MPRIYRIFPRVCQAGVMVTLLTALSHLAHRSAARFFCNGIFLRFKNAPGGVYAPYSPPSLYSRMSREYVLGKNCSLTYPGTCALHWRSRSSGVGSVWYVITPSEAPDIIHCLWCMVFARMQCCENLKMDVCMQTDSDS